MKADQGHIESSSQEGTVAASKSESLVHTPTTYENLRKIQEVADIGTPLLLEGATGVGKVSYTILIIFSICMLQT